MTKDGLLLYNRTNNTFAAWTDLSAGDYCGRRFPHGVSGEFRRQRGRFGNSSDVRELGTLSSAYAIEGVGEYDGEAGADLLLRDTSTGALSYWGGGASDKFASLGTSIDNSFAVIH